MALVLYQLHWSNLFTSLRSDTLVFLGLTFTVFLAMAFSHRIPESTGRSETLSKPIFVAIGIYFAAAFIENGGVPLVQLFTGAGYDVYGFGLPGIHVVMLALTGYHGVRAAQSFFDTADRRALVAFLIIVLLLASIGSRSALSFLLFASMVLYLRSRRLGVARTVSLIATAALFLFLFGSFGNSRLSQQIYDDSGRVGSSSAILAVSQSSSEFADTGLPAEWLWPYMYVASPLGNLNGSFEYSGGRLCGNDCDLTGLLVHEAIPDIASSRIADWTDTPEFDKSAFLIAPNLTASTTFGSAIGFAGLVGGLVMLALLTLLSIGALKVLRNTTASEEGIAILATLLFFSSFENMIAYSPMSLQLIFVLFVAHRQKPRRTDRLVRQRNLSTFSTAVPRKE